MIKKKTEFENCVLLAYYAASSSNLLPTFRDNLPAPCLGFLIPEDGTDRFPETSVRNYHYSLPNDP